MTQPQPPVVLLHGWGGSFAPTWARPGSTAGALEEPQHLRLSGVDHLSSSDPTFRRAVTRFPACGELAALEPA